MRIIRCLIVLICPVCWAAESSDLDFILASSLPRELITFLSTEQGHEPYALSDRLNPYYLRADFNGDDQADVAVLVLEKESEKRGILVVHGGENQYFVLGAGTAIGHGGDDFAWMDAWYVYPRGVVYRSIGEEEPPTLRGDALMAIKTESASALIYWTGTEYAWYQQGD